MVKLYFPASPTQFDKVLFSSVLCVVIAQADFKFFFRGNFSYKAVDSVCPWREVSSGSFYVAILNLSPLIS